MNHKSSVLVFLDDSETPLGHFATPVSFELNTHQLADGEHTLRLVSRDVQGKEGIRKIPFVVRNGPAVAIEGLQEHEVVDGVIPIMINAYGKGDQKRFIIEGSETPHSIPAWLWVLVIGFAGWAIYYAVTSLLV